MMYFGVFFLELLILFLLSRKITQQVFSLLLKVLKGQKITLFFFAFIFYPGVLLHELAHYIMALLLFVPAKNMEFTPVMRGNSVKLGSVEVVKSDPIRRMLIGVAPILVGITIISIAVFYFISFQSITFSYQAAIFIYLLFVIGNTMFSSKKDLEGTFEFLIIVFVILGVLYYFGVRIPPQVIQFFQSSEVISVVAQMNIYIGVPIAINIVILTLARILRV